MASYNKVILIGNLTKDPELRYTPSNAAICEFTAAVNRKWSGKDGVAKEEVSFIDCIAWARTAEVIAQYLKKGNPIMVEGRLTQDRWQDKNTGQSRSRVRVTVERFNFIGSRHESDNAAPDQPAEMPADGEIPF